MRRGLIVFLAVFLFGIGVVSARQIRQADECTVRIDETIEGNLFAACRTLLVEGTITGDLIAAAATARINGTVEGSVYLLSGQLDVYGTVGEDVHFVGPVLKVHPTAVLENGDLISLTLSTVSSAPVRGSVVGAGYQLVLEGNVGREVNFLGTALTIAATVSGDVYASVGDPNSTGVAELRALLTPVEVDLRDPGLYVTQEGMVGGLLTYSGPVEGQILVELPREPVFQQVIQADLAALPESENLTRSISAYFSQVLREFITLSLVGALVVLLIPRMIEAPIPTLRLRPLPSIGVGLLTFILSFPIFFMIILLSIILVLVLSLLQLPELTLISTLIAGVVDFSAIGLFYFVAFIISRVIVALALGRFLVRRLFGDDTGIRALLVSLLIGVALLTIFASLPFVGWLVSALALFLGLGAILTLLQEELERARAARPPELAAQPIEGHPAAPPALDDEPHELGTENLPEGFKWWS